MRRSLRTAPVTWYTYSEAGSREVNEDRVGVAGHDDCRCFVVADGLGGHGKGEVASRLAVEAFEEVFSGAAADLSGAMSSAFLLAQERILEEQRGAGTPFRMKTTAAALAIRGDTVMWGHIGDSRVYAFSRFRLKARTQDHSVPQMLALAGEIREREIRGHPDRSRLLRVLGEPGTPKFEQTGPLPLKKYRAFLLCSDGFWELVEEREMLAALRRSADARAWTEQMLRIVEQRGAGREMDNYSAVAVMV